VLATIGVLYLVIQITFRYTVDCHSLIMGTITSPDNKYDAKYSQKSCKGKPAVIEIWLGEKGSNKSTLAFSALATSNKPLYISWLSNKKLEILYPNMLLPDTKTSDIDGIFITHKAINDKST